MKKLGILSIGTLLIFGGCQMHASSQEIKSLPASCSVSYRFLNPSLGPVYGERKLKVSFEGTTVKNIVDLMTGRNAERNKGTPGVRVLKEYLSGTRRKELQYRFDKEGKLLEIRKEGALGGSYRIEILRTDCW